jgi:hypothetical protein
MRFPVIVVFLFQASNAAATDRLLIDVVKARLHRLNEMETEAVIWMGEANLISRIFSEFPGILIFVI